MIFRKHVKSRRSYLWDCKVYFTLHFLILVIFFILHSILKRNNRHKIVYFNKNLHKNFIIKNFRMKPVENEKVDICITLFSCDRLHLLKETLKRILSHIQKYEPDLTYALNWVDQASEGRDEILAENKFHHRLMSYKRMGHPFAFTMGFNLCNNADYIFLLEEDWYLNDPKIPFIKNIIKILNQSDPSIFGVVIREIPHEWYEKSGKQIFIKEGVKCVNLLNLPFHFTNGPSIYRMSTIKQLLRIGGYTHEAEFGVLAKNHNKTYMIIDDKRYYYNLFEHKGGAVSSDKGQICNNIVW
ncbi:hypothetical protein TRFO_13651 [Tritrichomonas foetus]|uniref:Glycosyltransferase 2-like domain-containing protein n=1 Tax=Tritrichomonas foetus TaxID=1144522 RepID=A0A1J4KXQ6_9EUKA|nr:hypothetical protein TRFO_13651 [Tritrichomonas foetus]|eukprot:OHT15962.1 hypothetical protein TRFO_13651 [Tritrichomonas foetus]